MYMCRSTVQVLTASRRVLLGQQLLVGCAWLYEEVRRALLMRIAQGHVGN